MKDEHDRVLPSDSGAVQHLIRLTKPLTPVSQADVDAFQRGLPSRNHAFLFTSSEDGVRIIYDESDPTAIDLRPGSKDEADREEWNVSNPIFDPDPVSGEGGKKVVATDEMDPTIVLGKRVYYNRRPPDLGKDKPYFIRFRLPTGAHPDKVNWIQDPAKRIEPTIGDLVQIYGGPILTVYETWVEEEPKIDPDLSLIHI